MGSQTILEGSRGLGGASKRFRRVLGYRMVFEWDTWWSQNLFGRFQGFKESSEVFQMIPGGLWSVSMNSRGFREYLVV